MDRELIILGAGNPHKGVEHSVLRKTDSNGNSKVFDWLLNAVDLNVSHVVFVGGYQIEDVVKSYPDFSYVNNVDWKATGAAYSLLQTDLDENKSYLVTYSDILFRRSLVEDIYNKRSDVVVAVDTQWKARYSGRTEEDILRCEKVCLKDECVMRLGSDIAPVDASAEFMGLVYFGQDAIKALRENRAELVEKFRKENLSDLIELLRIRGLEITFVDAVGDWAELNEPQDLAHFILGTKAQTLLRLKDMVSHSHIEDQSAFTVREWLKNPQVVLDNIQSKFQKSSLVVRSSALSEDGFSCSNAGAYESVLNVNGGCAESLRGSIERVILSYPESNPENQVLVQPMLMDTITSGVVFTRSLSHGAPYYVINYDDQTGSTDSITGGSSQAHQTFIVHKECCLEKVDVPKSLTGILPALQELESLLGYDSLDVEFAISRKGVHVLQVRPIAVSHSRSKTSDHLLSSFLRGSQKRFMDLQSPSPFIVGERTFFGIMPDWNPAEIVGTKPDRLAMSLYCFLITDDVWARQRAEYGYRDVRPHPLLVAFAGHPYIDVRASFNSFIPASIGDDLAGKLVNFYLDWLERYPYLHDKVEFDVLPTCYAFDFDKWNARLSEEASLSIKEINQLKKALLSITSSAISRNDQDFARVSELEKRFYQIKDTNLPPLEKAYILLEDCRLRGTVAFAHLARSAFVAVTLLKSAVHCEIISQAEADDFLASIRTVSHAFTHDAQAVNDNTLCWEQFVEKYGHLRPGTYDIKSASYYTDPDHYLMPVVQCSGHSTDSSTACGDLWKGAKTRFARALKDHNIRDDVESVERFMRTAIEGREYAKFIFTRNLSHALDRLVDWGADLKISRDDMAHITIEDILSIRKGTNCAENPAEWLLQRSQEGKEIQKITSAIELPPLIKSPKDFLSFMYPSTQANFVGSKSIMADCFDLSLHRRGTDLTGKIAIIPQADPGFDWLFGQRIAGLITMYGGANSHMAIRAAEFGIPAAIGVGENSYQQIVKANVLELDPKNRTIRIIR